MHSLLKYGMILPALLTWGCASVPHEKHVVAPGEPLRVSLTCRLANGDLVVTTDKGTADSPSIKKSSIYFPLKSHAPLSLKAGVLPEQNPAMWGFMDELHACVAKAAPGMVLGESRDIECRPELVPGRVGEERFLRMARVRKRPKDMRLPRTEYLEKVGHEPLAGEAFTLNTEFPGTVTEVTDKDVVISFRLPEQRTVKTPYGTGMVRDAGDHFEIELPLKAGDIVRSGSLAGRVSEVSDAFITIDYGYSFAGETVRCRVDALAGEEQQ